MLNTDYCADRRRTAGLCCLLSLFISLSSAAAEDCCTVVSVDRENGLVIATNREEGTHFRIEIDSLKLLRALERGTSFTLTKDGESTLFSIALGAAADGLDDFLTEDLGSECCDFDETYDETYADDGEWVDDAEMASVPELPPAIEILPGVELQIKALKRSGTRSVKLEYTVRNNSESEYYPSHLGVVRAPYTAGAYDVSHLSLVDLDGGMKYGVIVDGDGTCLCSRGSMEGTIGPAQVRTYWAQFTAPPANVHTVMLEGPGGAIDGLYIEP